MSHSLAELLQATALVFCRVGACLVLMPGLSSARVPVTVRVLLALVVSGNLAVLLWPRMQPLVGAIDIGEFARMVVLESISGAALGLVARIYFSALAFSASCIVSVIGLGGAPSPPVDDSGCTVGDAGAGDGSSLGLGLGGLAFLLAVARRRRTLFQGEKTNP